MFDFLQIFLELHYFILSCARVSRSVWLWLSSSNKPSGRGRQFLVPPTCAHTLMYIHIMNHRYLRCWERENVLSVDTCMNISLSITYMYFGSGTCVSSKGCFLYVTLWITMQCPICYGRVRWWVLWLTTAFTCGTWGRRDQPSFTPSSSTERGKSAHKAVMWRYVCHVFILPLHSSSSSFSLFLLLCSPLPPQLGPCTLSGATWTVSLQGGAVSQFAASVNC